MTPGDYSGAVRSRSRTLIDCARCRALKPSSPARATWCGDRPLLILLFGTHLFLTFRLRFIQRYLPHGDQLSFSREKEGEGDVSQFGALTTALAATIGTGNIVGVATAVAAGGPGAVLWMWLTGVFGDRHQVRRGGARGEVPGQARPTA